ncbi:MAG: CoA pyrophosphatase, partial [Bacteroidia bacterium]|nr:CoA pyrophosphatase [Bacteroidia bacterium]
MDFKEFLNAIPKIKNIPLPAQESQFKMSPPFRKALIRRYEEKRKTARQAAVLAMVYPDNEFKTKLALILRNTYHGVHSAQVGFPGGKVEREDPDLESTALRETEEEIGVDRSSIKIIKELTEVYIPPSNFNVRPFLGLCEFFPEFSKQDEEVRDIIQVPLEHLLSDERVVVEKVATSY